MTRGLKVLILSVAPLITFTATRAQGKSARAELPKSWEMMDKAKDGYFGISLDTAYGFLKAKGLKSKTVIVAVIDTGIDTLQEDLKDVLWVNPKEIPGNGIDDDHNGYIDDVHGWNFLGNKDGRNVTDDASEEARIYYKYKQRFEDKDFDKSTLKEDEKDTYTMWAKAKKKIMGPDTEASAVDLVMMKRVVSACLKSDSILQKAMGKTEYTGHELESFQPINSEGKTAKSVLLYLFKEEHLMDMTNKMFLEEFQEETDQEAKKIEQRETPPKNYRHDVVMDDESDINDKNYGNNNVMAGSPVHGTHVSGTIAAVRNNGKGINGIDDNVRIMMLRVVPNGDEHDKDIALAIRYAVDNGAKVVNMSFGKSLSPQKLFIDDAVKYADEKGVLLVHAAGNEAENIDSADNFPNADFKGTKNKAPNWITVGASSDPAAESANKGYLPYFTNFGKKEVDVFAPGTRIYSTLPGGNKYGEFDGTSMASPMVTGIAALIMEYYPSLTPEQVKLCIEKSVSEPLTKSKRPDSEQIVNFSDISASGGIVNAYGAVKMAYIMTNESKTKEPMPKSSFSNKKD
jgi:cell wall-associated protease